MSKEEALRDIGFTEGESRVYLALLKLGPSTVNEISKETNQHRTTIYDFIEKLQQKGVVSSVKKGNVAYYKAADPENLKEYMKEKENKLNSVLPELKKLAEFSKDEISVEVYKGVEGFKAVLNDRLREGGDFYAFGVDESLFKERFRTIMEQFFRKEKELNQKEFLLTKESAKFVYPYKHVKYRYIPDEYFDPTPYACYGKDRIYFHIWKPFTVILIKNKELADTYKKHFKLLWKMAKERPPRR